MSRTRLIQNRSCFFFYFCTCFLPFLILYLFMFQLPFELLFPVSVSCFCFFAGDISLFDRLFQMPFPQVFHCHLPVI